VTDNNQTAVELNSEVLATSGANGETLEYHLVSYSEADGERYAIYVYSSTVETGSVVARFEPTVPYNVAVSMFLSMTMAFPVSGSERASELMTQLYGSPEDTGLIIPDTTTVETINK